LSGYVCQLILTLKMALVPWTYNNPRTSSSRDAVRQFVFGGHLVEVLQDFSADIDVTKNTERKLWDGSFLLTRYLEHAAVFPAGFWSDRHCIELGAGCGLTGLVAWLLGARVTLTDLPSATEHTKRCVSANVDRLGETSAFLSERSSAIQVKDYTWGSVQDLQHLSPPYDVVFGSDIVYSADSSDSLVEALRVLCGPRTLVLMSYKARGLGEDVFFTKLANSGFTVTCVPQEFHPTDFVNSEYYIYRISKSANK